MPHGAQPERTLLAWKRTCLAIAVGGLALARYGALVAGPGAAATGLLAVALAAIAYALAARRYRTAWTGATAATLPHDGRPLAALAGALVAVGLACGVALVSLAG